MLRSFWLLKPARLTRFAELSYARAYLPVLASVMMSDQVRRGDTIGIPVPNPRAWTETVEFVYTGVEELATEPVKQNILYLGGKV